MHVNLIDAFPYRFSETEAHRIVLADGAGLATKLWLPAVAEGQRLPCIIEVLPYRKRDAYSVRDSMHHRYFAGHGYASMRIDMRGSGDSDGHQEVFDFAREQDDTLEVLAWIERQAWSDGQVAIFGVSWGGLQAIQVAARRPRQLRCIVPVAFAHDHFFYGQVYFGGCVPLRAPRWSAQMFGYKSRPPDPAQVGDRWRAMWLERLAHNEPQIMKALEHPLHDAMWTEQGIDFRNVHCPVLAVGGWADVAYVGSVMQALTQVSGPSRGLIGPWGHNFPHLGVPGPAIGFLQEVVQWFERWMKAGPDQSPHDEPVLRAWLARAAPAKPFYAQSPGRWVEEGSWPSAGIQPVRHHLNARHTLDLLPGETEWVGAISPQSTGLQGGELMPWFQHGPAAELPGDQREDDGKSLCFDSVPLAAELDILGAPIASLRLKVDRASAFVCVRLCDVAPDGASTRVAIGVRNLAHSGGSTSRLERIPGEAFDIDVPLVPTGYTFAAGHRIRIAISTTYWPLIWPSPEPVRLDLATGVSTIALPARAPDSMDGTVDPFDPPEAAVPRQRALLEPGKRTRETTHDADRQTLTVSIHDTAGRSRFEDIDLEIEAVSTERYVIREADPLSCRADIAWTWLLQRGDWLVRTETAQSVSCTASHFVIDWSIRAYEQDRCVFERSRQHLIERHGN